MLTVCWTTSVLITLLCEVGSLAASWLADLVGEGASLDLFGRLALFAAAVVALVALVLTALVQRSAVKPPRGFTVFALAVAVAPWITLALRAAR
jgi:hypothetical protein